MPAWTDDDAAARKHTKALRRRLELEKEVVDGAINILYRAPEGRAFLNWLLEVSKAIGQQPFHRDPYLTAFACGENNIGLQIMARMVEVNPIAFAELLKERQEQENAQRAARDNDGGNDLHDFHDDGGGADVTPVEDGGGGGEYD